MTFQAWTIEGPAGTRFAGVKMRLAALSVADYPEEDKLKVVLQVVLPNGRPDVLDPISVDWLTPAGLDNYIEESKLAGWKFSSDSTSDSKEKRLAYQREFQKKVREKRRESGIYPTSKIPAHLRDRTDQKQ